MTYSDGLLEYPIDGEGREVEVVHPKLKFSSPGETDYYRIYPHCPYDLGVRLEKIKGSLYKCPGCGGYFSVSKEEVNNHS
jgi:hypothetical protein